MQISKRCLVFVLVMLLYPALSHAQEEGTSQPAQQGVYKDGVAILNGQIFLLENGTKRPLQQQLNLNGTSVSPDGTLKTAAGKTSKLKEGMAVNKQGRVVIFKDDMFTPAVIDSNTKEVGYEHNTVIIEHPDTVIIRKE